MDAPGAEGAFWTLQAVADHLRGRVNSIDVHTASGTVDERAEVRAGVTPGFEMEVHTPVMFTVSLKVAGVEKARVTAKARPGTQRK